MLIHVFDRSRLNDISCIKADGTRLTYLEDLQQSKHYHRADVVLMNLTNTGREYCLYVSKHGFEGCEWLLDVLTPEQYVEVMDIADRMRRNAMKHEACQQLIYD